VQDHQLTVRRTFQASAAKVFEAFVSAEALKEWWSPEGFTAVEAHVDARMGGKYRVVMRSHTGSDVVYVHGTYLEISPPTRLVFTHTFERRSSYAPLAEVGLGALRTRVTVIFQPRGDVTEVVLLQEKLSTADAEQMLRLGWEGILGKLAGYLGGAPDDAG
jgi:uncharacterized protein YndB with AHSA1/START domain